MKGRRERWREEERRREEGRGGGKGETEGRGERWREEEMEGRRDGAVEAVLYIVQR